MYEFEIYPSKGHASDHKAVDSRRDASVKNHLIPEFKSYFSHSANPSPINLDGFGVKPPLKLPYQKDTKRWKEIDKEVSKQLSYIWRKISSSDISKAMKLFEDCVYSTLEQFCKTIRKLLLAQNPNRISRTMLGNYGKFVLYSKSLGELSEL